MENNPFEPPRASVGGRGELRRVPLVVALLALSCAGVMVGVVTLALLTRPLIEAIVVVFFSAFLSFVPFGLLRGRPWAPAAGAAAGLFAGVFALGSLVVAEPPLDTTGVYYKMGAGIFALSFAVATVLLRSHPFFAVEVTDNAPGDSLD